MTTLIRTKQMLILLALPLMFFAGYGLGYHARALKHKKWYVHVQDVQAALKDLDDLSAWMLAVDYGRTWGNTNTHPIANQPRK